jgi:hypothetical protein
MSYDTIIHKLSAQRGKKIMQPVIGTAIFHEYSRVELLKAEI